MRSVPVLLVPLFLVGIAAAAESGENLNCKFKMAAVRSSQPVKVSCTAQAEAVYACFKNNGVVTEQKKEGAPVSAFAEFTSGADGMIAGVVVVAPPAPSLVCPKGEERRVCSVKYRAIQITSPGAPAADLAGTVHRTMNGCRGEDGSQVAPFGVLLPQPGK